MKRSFLENLLNVIEDESARKNIINSILDENGNDLNTEKAKIESVRNDLKVKESLIEELNGKIKANSEIDIEKIKEEEFNRGKEEGSKEFDEFKKTNALKNSIKGAKDVDYVISKLDIDKLEFEKNEQGDYLVSGVEDQLKDIRQKHSFVFDDVDNVQDEPQEISLGGYHSNPSATDGLSILEEAMGIKKDK